VGEAERCVNKDVADCHDTGQGRCRSGVRHLRDTGTYSHLLPPSLISAFRLQLQGHPSLFVVFMFYDPPPPR